MDDGDSEAAPDRRGGGQRPPDTHGGDDQRRGRGVRVSGQLRRAVVVGVFIALTAGCSLVEPDESPTSKAPQTTAAEQVPRSSAEEQTSPPRSEVDQAEPDNEPEDGSARPDGDYAVVVYVVDGDTFDVEFTDGVVERIRTPQIDTPERDDCGFDEATRFTEELILGQTVELIPTRDGPDRDPYDRLLRAVEIDGDDVGAILVRAGAARWAPRYANEDLRLAAMYEPAEEQARREAIGFWSGCGWS
ncbi:thermonuclease family protein [Phytoactinopolyspora endophytica]|uniref:thermonuclease family protein n=1 Tax=Phytoactinopolyspora endophytica TaxID=1642495 RepID=UPI00101CB300|nr:thermonuclease family protein [Phytoactinopolyspora endophytica]